MTATLGITVVGLIFWGWVVVMLWKRRRGHRAGNPMAVYNRMDLGWRDPAVEAEKAERPEDPPAIIEPVDPARSPWQLSLPPQDNA